MPGELCIRDSTCTARATVSDAWGTPSYAIFTVQQKNGESYVDTAVTGRAGLSSTSFNGSGATNTVKLDLSGLEAGKMCIRDRFKARPPLGMQVLYHNFAKNASLRP